jgi:hypothetical protein
VNHFSISKASGLTMPLGHHGSLSAPPALDCMDPDLPYYGLPPNDLSSGEGYEGLEYGVREGARSAEVAYLPRLGGAEGGAGAGACGRVAVAVVAMASRAC